MQSNIIYFVCFILIFFLTGCDGCSRENCNIPPKASGEIYFNEDSSKVVINYRVDDNNPIDLEITKKITIGDSIVSENVYNNIINKSDTFDLSWINKTTQIKLDLDAKETFQKFESGEECYYEPFKPKTFTTTLNIKKDYHIFKYNIREVSILILLFFLLGCLLEPSFSLEDNKKSLTRSIKFFLVFLPLCIGLILSVLELNSLVEGASKINIWKYITIIFILLTSGVISYLIYKFVISKIII